jgi:hypothetical protein
VAFAPDIELALERGEAAAALLRSACFISVVDDLSNYHLAALCASPPGDASRDARDFHHLLHHALTLIVDELRTREATAAELMNRDNEDDD